MLSAAPMLERRRRLPRLRHRLDGRVHLRRRRAISARHSDRRSAVINARSAICAPTPRCRARSRRPSRRSRCRTRSCLRCAIAAAGRRAVARPRRRRYRKPRVCAASAISPPTPTISAAPRRKPTAPRGKPMPTCRRPRRNSTGSSRAWKTAAPIPTRPIRMTNRWRRPTVTRRSRLSRRRASARGFRRIATASRRSAPAQAPCFRSRARLRSASCSFWSAPASCGASRPSRP